MSDIYIRLERPEDYDDVDRQLVIEDFTDNFRDNPQAWVYHDATDEITRLRAVVDAARRAERAIRNEMMAGPVSNTLSDAGYLLNQTLRALDGEV